MGITSERNAKISLRMWRSFGERNFSNISSTLSKQSKIKLILLLKWNTFPSYSTSHLHFKINENGDYLQIQEILLFFLTYSPLFYLESALSAAQLFSFLICCVKDVSMWLNLFYHSFYAQSALLPTHPQLYSGENWFF